MNGNTRVRQSSEGTPSAGQIGANAFRHRCIRRICIGIAFAMMVTGAAIATQELAANAVLVTQNSRSFQPGTVELGKEQFLHIVNDDGQLMHHVYVASSKYNFDSGEQPPGTAVDIRFPALGAYVVLCAIHPKMRLNVIVR